MRARTHRAGSLGDMTTLAARWGQKVDRGHEISMILGDPQNALIIAL